MAEIESTMEPRVESGDGAMAAVLAGGLLTACGGGGAQAPTPTPTPVPVPPPAAELTAAEASRFLAQASMGATREQIARVQAIGYAGWLDEQFAMAASGTRWDWLVSKGFDALSNKNGEAGADPAIWRKMLSSPDTLRQRITLALSEIMVASVSGFSGGWKAFSAAAYLDLLEAQAFGNYRSLLQQVSTSAPMGEHLTFRGNVKFNAATGALPDENYARELMQLFTIGLTYLFESGNGNGNATFTCVKVSGNAVFMSGKSAVQYQVSTGGSVPLAGLKSPLFGSTACSDALRALVSQPRAHLLENEYSRVTKRSIDADVVLTGALASSAALATVFPAPNGLADQLKMVARMISAAPALGAKRQVFLVSLGGFDNHDEMLTVHPGLMTSVAGALAAFYKATAELGLAAKVAAFTASDFGRTTSGNNDGSDHGWGSMHFVLGGAVRGRNFYGTAPVVANNGPDDVGQGRLLPTTSVDQLAATLGSWLGVSDSDLLGLLPSLGNYNAATRKLGFI